MTDQISPAEREELREGWKVALKRGDITKDEFNRLMGRYRFTATEIEEDIQEVIGDE